MEEKIKNKKEAIKKLKYFVKLRNEKEEYGGSYFRGFLELWEIIYVQLLRSDLDSWSIGCSSSGSYPQPYKKAVKNMLLLTC